ncbi:MAG: DUF3352 domain-containing protein [Nocardioidaceae bacterium]
MSESQPPAEGPGPVPPPRQEWGTPPGADQPPGGSTEWLAGGPGRPDGEGHVGRRRGFVIGAVVAVLAVIIGSGSVLAFRALNGGGPQPADALPGNAIGYVRVDLDPSAAEKVAALQLLRKFPQFGRATGISSNTDDLRARMIDAIVAQTSCNLTYAKDFKPWIGSRVGVAAVPEGGSVEPVVAVAVDDRSAAEATVKKLDACDSSGAHPGDSFVNGYLLLAKNQSLADRYATEAASSSLADNPRFRADMSKLGDQGLISVWVDMDRARGLIQKLTDAGSPFVGSSLGTLPSPADVFKGVHSYAAAVRASGDYVELAFQADGGSSAAGTTTPVRTLPDSTVMALSFSGGGENFTKAWDRMRSAIDQMQPGAFEQAIARTQAQTGLVLPADMTTLLGDNLTLTVDGEGLDPQVLQGSTGPQDAMSKIGVGVRLTTDQAAAKDLLSRIQAALDSHGVGIKLASADVSDGLVIASNQAYADKLAANGSLGDSSVFTSAVSNADKASAIFYLNVDTTSQIVKKFIVSAGGDTSQLDKIAPIKAVGLSAWPAGGGYTEASLRVTFN